MTPREFLRQLRQKDVRLTINGSVLHYDAPVGVLTPEDLDTLRQLKPFLIEAVRCQICQRLLPKGQVMCEGDCEDVPGGTRHILPFAPVPLWLQAEAGWDDEPR